ncbi:2-keto-4-pentenoate hydratase [Aliibacillus thermotolerans]|uniref:2-keto-4-pentenoate hydratase n=1 Tax=Aliibacillus thermotolerans TaxID=1834418 RepID=A0ABW0UAY1_9BACI|nr:fumarylacetoacetate hydrolase family protein [Aliibacillus thermotolerans]MDA3129598.1 2-keto-4-pentenoate hydratase [Aliibacillus thermotolerans]
MNIKEAVSALIKAEKTKQTIDPFTSNHKITKDEAYQIQLGVIDYKLENGAKVVGKKIGLTSKAMQEMLGVNIPDYGHLLDYMIYREKEAISLEPFIQPKVEFEIGFVLKDKLQGPGVTTEDVIKATDYVVPAIEIIDSRIHDWKFKFEDTVADNGSSAGAILGKNKKELSDISLPEVKMSLYKNDEFIESAYGSAVMGNPMEAVAWLANEVGHYDISLNPGEIILSGALSKAMSIEPGDHFKADFENLGTVSAVFEN